MTVALPLPCQVKKLTNYQDRGMVSTKTQEMFQTRYIRVERAVSGHKAIMQGV
jgi:hypothetical protein